MAVGELLRPTLHIEVRLNGIRQSLQLSQEVRGAVKARLLEDFDAVEVGQHIDGLEGMKHEEDVACVEIADYTGPASPTGYHSLADVQLDVQSYMLKPERQSDSRRYIHQGDQDTAQQVRYLALPNVLLNEAWGSLVFEDALPSRLLRYLVRMVDMMSKRQLNLSAFNWNRLCLLHGPPGSGKSTLCRALVQKLSIRLGGTFSTALLAEINTNSMLSKYFGESGKQIGSMFEQIYTMCQDRKTLVCVVMDEVETIAGSREQAAGGSECADGLRATNQLLTALDRLRNLPNVIVLCTSNLIEAIDPAFLDRVDIKQYVPCPSASAIYKIFRSCLNELIRSDLVGSTVSQSSSHALATSSTLDVSEQFVVSSSPHKPNTRSKAKKTAEPTQNSALSSSPDLWDLINPENENKDNIPTCAEMIVRSSTNPNPESAGERVWSLAQKCHGLSGRTLRRLPILGLAMFTWGGECSLGDAISALEKAVEQELAVVKDRNADVDMEGI